MDLRRRTVLLGGAAVTGFGLVGYHVLTGCDELACFSFEYHGADDVPSRLDIEHTGGDQRLRAGDVYVTNVTVDYESQEMDTFAWAELDEDLDPDETIDGESLEVSIAWTEIVEIRWRQDGRERVIEAWVYDDDVAR